MRPGRCWLPCPLSRVPCPPATDGAHVQRSVLGAQFARRQHMYQFSIYMLFAAGKLETVQLGPSRVSPTGDPALLASLAEALLMHLDFRGKETFHCKSFKLI